MIQDGITGNAKSITSFLMIGQSNMAGRGDIADVDPIRNSNCYMLRMGRWQVMTEPINPDRGIFQGRFRSGISLGASFADGYEKHFGKKVGLIPCTDGGTMISQWQPGEVLFDHAVFMAKLAMRTSNFGGILWHQGESDCDEGNVAHYKDQALRMIHAIRKELGAEDLPFIFGELSEVIAPKWEFGDYPMQMNEIFREMEKEIPNCRLVSSRELTLKADGIHFDAPSLREFGRRYFDAYLDLVK